MSTETGKENASVVDSSMSEWKQDVGNSDDPESVHEKAKKDGGCFKEEESGYCRDRAGNSETRAVLYNTRYFIIKSLNHDNIQLSIEKGIWATQVRNEPILEEAFHNSGKVILIFSVNMSGFFQGYAQMTSSVGWRRDNVWNHGSGKNNPWGRSFKVKWLRLNELPFQKTVHLKNPLNDYKPVKISRDCQELSPDVGEALCELLDDVSNAEDPLASFSGDNFQSKRACLEPPCSLENEEYNMPPLRLSCSGTPMLYPSILYQHQGEANRFHIAPQTSAGFIFPGNSPFPSGASTVPMMKNARIDREISSLHVDRYTPSRFDNWGLSAESPPSTLTEDDFLEMSYEEYLEVHSRGNKKFYFPASSGSPGRTQESSGSKKHNEDMHHSRKRTHHSTEK